MDDASRALALAQFVERCNALPPEQMPPLYRRLLDDSCDSFASKWLIARNFVVDDAFAMFVAACEFRLVRGLDDLSLFPSATALQGYDVAELIAFTGKPPRVRPAELDTIVRNIRTCVTRCWHKCDKVRTHPADAIDLLGCVICAHQFLFIISNFAFWKGGRPVCIERTGRINSKKLCNVHKSLMTAADPSPIFTAHLHSVEVGRSLMRYNNSKRAAGSDEVTQVTVIMDVAGLGMHTLYPPALALLRANGASKTEPKCAFVSAPSPAAHRPSSSGTADQNFYPESLYKLFVVNTPAIISVAWRIISPWVDARTKSKIVFLKPGETAEELRKHIHEEALPADLGGTCACEGGCLMDETSADDDGFIRVPVNVKKGAKCVMLFHQCIFL